MKIHSNGVHEWHHKDGRRQYWRIHAWPTGALCNEDQDEEWGYHIYLEEGVIAAGGVVHQRALPHPEPHDIFNDWISWLLTVSAGFARSAEEWYPYPGEGKP